MPRRLPVVAIKAALPDDQAVALVTAAGDEDVPPRDDEPLDEIEQALVRSLVRIFVRQIREEAVASPRPADAAPTRRRIG